MKVFYLALLLCAFASAAQAKDPVNCFEFIDRLRSSSWDRKTDLAWTPIPEISSERLVIRKLLRDERRKYVPLLRPDVLGPFFSGDKSLDQKDWHNIFRGPNLKAQNSELYQVNLGFGVFHKETEALVGVMELGFYDLKEKGWHPLGISYVIFEEHRNKGYATEALQAVSDFSFQAWDFDFNVAWVHVKNHASHRVLEKAGFEVYSEVEEKRWYRRARARQSSH